MSTSHALTLILPVIAFFLCRKKARAIRSTGVRLHSSETYHAWFGLLFVFLSTTILTFIIYILEIFSLNSLIRSEGDTLFSSTTELKLLKEDVLGKSKLVITQTTADTIFRPLIAPLKYMGFGLIGEQSAAILNPQNDKEFLISKVVSMRLSFDVAKLFLIPIIGSSVLLFALFRVHSNFKAREIVEFLIKIGLGACSLLALLTTLGIVISLLSETFNFLKMYPLKDFLFGTVWNPQFRGGSDLGFIPLLWGTMYISLVALFVAVPIGLFSAIYLSEYASNTLRSIAKPLLELLAGIPTIVYGLFALLTVGPLIRDYFAQPLGLGTSANSVIAAGVVMGIMLIPFVSSLSDDIMNAVPQDLRDVSYALGATKSETVKKVILPAALPGIVGAILLATSRAVGETMIVVLGAGAAAKISGNPFEGMAAITAKIVNQLTGDTEFESPETLVAFALGLSLFFITLCLNVFALRVVRKYQEKYD